jgi:hypothetical protein
MRPPLSLSRFGALNLTQNAALGAAVVLTVAANLVAVSVGTENDAKETVSRLRAITHLIVPNAWHWRNPEHRELFLSGLRLEAV